MTRSVAAELVRDFPADRIRRQVEVVDWLRETKPKRVKDVGAYLAEAIRKDFAAPAGFKSQAERAEAEATVRARQEREERARRSKAREREERARIVRYWAEVMIPLPLKWGGSAPGREKVVSGRDLPTFRHFGTHDTRPLLGTRAPSVVQTSRDVGTSRWLFYGPYVFMGPTGSNPICHRAGSAREPLLPGQG